MGQHSSIKRRGWVAAGIVLAVLVIDQVIKIWVKTHMYIGETAIEWDAFGITWFKMTFLENNGAAGNLNLFGSKILLTLFRFLAIIVMGYYMWLLTKKKELVRWGYYICLALILAGAAGNLIDCMFYGLCFSASPEYTTVVADYVGWGGAGHYAGFLEGMVVDMFRMPFTFVWNIADAAITIGVILLLLFYRKELSELSFGRSKMTSETSEEIAHEA